MKKTFISSALLILMMAMPSLVNAQLAPPTGPPCWPPPCIPVDNGVILLIIAVIAYGGKKLYDAKKQQELKTKAE